MDHWRPKFYFRPWNTDLTEKQQCRTSITYLGWFLLPSAFRWLENPCLFRVNRCWNDNDNFFDTPNQKSLIWRFQFSVPINNPHPVYITIQRLITWIAPVASSKLNYSLETLFFCKDKYSNIQHYTILG